MFKATIPQEDLSDRAISDRVIIFLRKINRAADINSKKLIKQIGLTGPQLIILREISQTDEITASDISKAISLSQATVTGILDRLDRSQCRFEALDPCELPLDRGPDRAGPFYVDCQFNFTISLLFFLIQEGCPASFSSPDVSGTTFYPCRVYSRIT